MKKIIKIVGIVLLTTFVLVAGIFMEVRCTINKYFKMHVVTEKSEYGEWKDSFIFLPIIFPHKITGLNVKEYKYMYREYLVIDPDAQYILLTVAYNKTEFQEEVNRIQHIKDEYSTIEYNEKDYELPALVANDEGDSYQFALLDKEKYLIHYVFVQFPPAFENEKYVTKKLFESYDEDIR